MPNITRSPRVRYPKAAAHHRRFRVDTCPGRAIGATLLLRRALVMRGLGVAYDGRLNR